MYALVLQYYAVLLRSSDGKNRRESMSFETEYFYVVMSNDNLVGKLENKCTA